MAQLKHLKKVHLLVIFLFISVIPDAISHKFNADSMRFGITVGISIFLLIAFFYYRGALFLKSNWFMVLNLFSMFIAIQLLLLMDKISLIDVYRLSLSVLFLYFLFISAAFFSNYINLIDNRLFHKVIRFSFTVLIADGIISSYLFYSGINNKPFLFLFSEPSHFSLIYAPFLLYFLHNSTLKERLLMVVLTLVIVLMFRNSTLLVVLFLSIFLIDKKFLIFFLLPLFLVFIDYFPFFQERVSFQSSNNLSLLVFFSGWERAYLSVIESNGLGLGFQQFGVYGPLGEVYDLIVGATGSMLNLYNGSTVGSKFIAEFGVFGIVLLFWYIVELFKLKINVLDDNKTVFFKFVFLSFVVDIFVRGTGYFTPRFFIFLVSVYWIYLMVPILHKRLMSVASKL